MIPAHIEHYITGEEFLVYKTQLFYVQRESLFLSSKDFQHKNILERIVWNKRKQCLTQKFRRRVRFMENYTQQLLSLFLHHHLAFWWISQEHVVIVNRTVLHFFLQSLKDKLDDFRHNGYQLSDIHLWDTEIQLVREFPAKEAEGAALKAAHPAGPGGGPSFLWRGEAGTGSSSCHCTPRCLVPP